MPQYNLTQWQNSLGGAKVVPVQDANTISGLFFAIQAGANGATINSQTGLSESWAGFPLAGGQLIMFGNERIKEVSLTAGEAVFYSDIS